MEHGPRQLCKRPMLPYQPLSLYTPEHNIPRTGRIPASGVLTEPAICGILDFVSSLSFQRVSAKDDEMRRTVRKATREQTRAHNSRLVLRMIYERGEISRADIARETRLTRTTVSDVVSDLMDQGLVEDVGYGPSAGGKPPILLSVVADSHHLIGLDLASAEFRGAVVNLRGQVRQQINVPLHNRDGEAALALVYDIVQHLIAATDSPLLGIGIGSPGLMDATNGIVRRSVNLGWRNLPLRDLLEERYGLPVYVANDSQVAALAEYIFGNGPSVENLVVVKVGQGIGAGIVLNGQIFHGETLGAGEIGHVAVIENGGPCRCGNVGCLETLASARAILCQARSLALDNPDSRLNQFAASPEEITLETICQAMEAGDQQVQQMICRVGQYLGIAAANIVGLLSARRIVIAGSVACLGQILLDAVRQEMIKRSLPILAGEAQVDLSSMGPEIVILGASAMVLNRKLGLFSLPDATM
jgi:N-acetylglucosamine repressor